MVFILIFLEDSDRVKECVSVSILFFDVEYGFVFGLDIKVFVDVMFIIEVFFFKYGSKNFIIKYGVFKLIFIILFYLLMFFFLIYFVDDIAVLLIRIFILLVVLLILW